MPLYEYQCVSCHERAEILQRASDPPYSHCPKCGGDMKKLFSSPAIQFKGSGFYKTDYASTSTAKPGKSEKSETSESSEKSEKAETKAESTTSETKTEKKSSSE